MSNLTHEEILSLIEGVVADEPEGAVTTQELTEAWGLNEESVRRRLRPLLREGKLEPVRVQRMRMDGVMSPVPAYRVVA